MLYATAAALCAVLLFFVWVGVRAHTPGGDLDEYLTARNSQGGTTLGLSFLASGLGAWILFAPPEIGAFVGPVAVLGYALGAALPFLILAWCGPAIRRRLPAGRSIAEYAQQRFGAGMRWWVSGLSALYMLCFLAAELTAVGGLTAMLSDIPPAWAVLAVAASTLAYTAWGGLRASLATDRWQAWLMLALLAVVLLALWPALSHAPAPLVWPQVPMADALPVALTLVIAVTVANLFHQGYWQRIWSAKDDTALRQGAWLGSWTTVLVVGVVGGLGTLAVALGRDLGQPPLPLFALLKDGPVWMPAVALLLGITLVTSSIDTLQNAVASMVATSRPGVTLGAARWITVLLMVPVIAIALQGLSVLRLFLVADLLCATAVVPLLLGLWQRMTRAAALAGALGGLVGAVLPGWWSSGSWLSGLHAATFPNSLPTLAPFVGALLGSALASALVWPLTRPRLSHG